jgi:hypothetical protein
MALANPAMARGQAGDQAGEHMLEVEFSIDELAEILGEKLSYQIFNQRSQKHRNQ